MTEKRQLSLNRNTKLSRSSEEMSESNMPASRNEFCSHNAARTYCNRMQRYERLQRLGLGLLILAKCSKVDTRVSRL